jgi:glycosyltransferase involved in cell wall biosynthesis
VSKPTVSIITASYNVRAILPTLVMSLRAQTDQDFEWIVADGGSTDGTLDYLATVSDLRVKLSSCPDRGVYDALNRAIRACASDYYLVVGADDSLAPGAVAAYRQAAQETGADLVCAGVEQQDEVVWPRHGAFWVNGGGARISHHSVGTLIRTALHDQWGAYSLRYRALADQHFIKRALMGGALRAEGRFVAGQFTVGGLSSGNILQSYTELLDYQLKTGEHPALQLLLFLARVVRHFGSIVRQARS